ncbi:MAG TPA: polysaccharide pyruvyl transferase family protein [Stenotrophomonas sp.]|jgi:polysaccharide pyruvyl transferase WcaK-like protein
MNVSFISVRTQYENLGDALINRELIRLLARQGRLVVDVSKAPSWFVDMLSLPDDVLRVRGTGRLLLRMVKERIAGHRIFYFFIPGGMRGEYTASRFARKLATLLPYYSLKMMGARFCQMGLSFESLGVRHKFFLRMRNRLMHAFYVRDTASSVLLAADGIDHSGLLPDLAFNLFESAARPVGAIATACLSFRTDQHPSQLVDCYEFVRHCVRALPEQTRYHLVVQVERDRVGMEALRARLREDHGIEAELRQETRDIEAMQVFYRSSDVVISNRLHVLLLGASVGARTVGYVDDTNRKITGMFETMGRADLLVAPQDLKGSDKLTRALCATPLDGSGESKTLSEGLRRIFAPGFRPLSARSWPVA